MSGIPAFSIDYFLDQLHPKTALAIGALAENWLTPYVRQSTSIKLKVIDTDHPLQELGELERYDFALVAGILESLPLQEASALIAALRDRYARTSLIVVPGRLPDDETNRFWTENDLLGLGLYRYAIYEYQSRPILVYQFSIGDYKSVPDWLNAKSWANPKLWDRYRW